MSSYVPLCCKTNFSFLEGASHPDELIEEAHRLGLLCLGLTDRDGVYGIVRAPGKAQELGLHLIIGSQITLDDGSIILLLAQDRAGYANLCRLLTGACPGDSDEGWRQYSLCRPGYLPAAAGNRWRRSLHDPR